MARLIDAQKALYLAEYSGLYDFDLAALGDLFDEPCISVDAIHVVHGQWENIAGNILEVGDCSNCKVRQPVRSALFRANYCRNCGAKMDGWKDGGK